MRRRRTERVLRLETLVVERDAVRDRIVLLDEIEAVRDDRVVLEAVATDLEQDLDHVLHALVDVRLVQDLTEHVVDARVGLGRDLGQEGADLAHEADGDLDAVVRRPLEQQRQDLEREDLVRDPLVAQLREERRRRAAGDLIVALERATELEHEPGEQEVAEPRQLGIDDGHERGEDGREGERRRLGAHDRTAEQPAAADQVLAEELGHDVLDVGDVDLRELAYGPCANARRRDRRRAERPFAMPTHLVDQTIERLAQGVPSQALVLLALLLHHALLLHLLHHLAHLVRRDVRAAELGERHLAQLGLAHGVRARRLDHRLARSADILVERRELGLGPPQLRSELTFPTPRRVPVGDLDRDALACRRA